MPHWLLIQNIIEVDDLREHNFKIEVVGHHLSIVGRLTLINLILDSLPLYVFLFSSHQLKLFKSSQQFK